MTNTAAKNGFTPTHEQSAIFAFARESKKNFFVRAGAGCGKSTVALEVLGMLLEGNSSLKLCYLAFNTDVKDDMIKKAPKGVEVMTFNGLGARAIYRAFGKTTLDPDNAFEMIKDRIAGSAIRQRYAFYKTVTLLLEKSKRALCDTIEEIDLVADGADLGLNGEQPEAVALVHEIMTTQRNAKTVSKIDYIDQIWLPIVKNLPMPKYDGLVMDEAQDTDPAQLELVKRAVGPNTRVMAVGDERQSIYWWRGADQNAIENIIGAFDMDVLPLMTTFRCGKAIVREAQDLVPEFAYGPNNHEGKVSHCNYDRLTSLIQPGDFVISRTNAPLVAACMKALREGIPAAVVGRDIGGSLRKLVEKLRPSSIRDLEEKLEVWARKETQKLESKLPVREKAIEALEDKVETLLAISNGCEDLDHLMFRLEDLFADGKKKGQAEDLSRVDFTSTHKAKGRERNRVFMLAETYMVPRKDKKTGEWIAPGREEENLKYVAITRAKHELIYVTGMKKRGFRRGVEE